MCWWWPPWTYTYIHIYIYIYIYTYIHTSHSTSSCHSRSARQHSRGVGTNRDKYRDNGDINEYEDNGDINKYGDVRALPQRVATAGPTIECLEQSLPHAGLLLVAYKSHVSYLEFTKVRVVSRHFFLSTFCQPAAGIMYPPPRHRSNCSTLPPRPALPAALARSNKQPRRKS